MLKLHVPKTIAPPVAHYVHGIEVPPNARWLYTAGQVGVTPDGETSDGFEAQSHQIWKNTIEILKAANMGVEDIVKLVVYATDAGDVKYISDIRKEYMGDHVPTSTFIGDIKLANPAWVVEMETIAAKAD
ncbi:MAG: RidA family protein [Alphaproteobacteria bacterium]|nr:RidA family protein [Alphaproteobacteria bacterium]